MGKNISPCLLWPDTIPYDGELCGARYGRESYLTVDPVEGRRLEGEKGSENLCERGACG